MTQAYSFQISEFTNPSGDIVFRLSGWLDGKRIRKNFPSRADAEAERQFLEIQRLQGETGIRPAVTRLNEDQLHEAESLFRRAQGLPGSLTFYLEYALANYREPQKQKKLSEAVAVYVATKEYEHDQDLLSEPHLTRVKRDLDRLQRHFPEATVAELTAARLIGYFEARRAAQKTFNNRRGVVSTFLKFAMQRDWIVENPLMKVPSKRIRRRRTGAATLTAGQAKELMSFIEENHPSAVPFFALCLFAGIRPCLRTGEILRLRPDHVRLAENLIRIDGEVSKVREPRPVTIQPNLAAWLHAYPLKNFAIVPSNLQHIREKAVDRFGLTHDVMRHTFISMFVAKFRSIGEAAIQAGNSESIIRKHYLDLKSPSEAESFFGILPEGRASRTLCTPEYCPQTATILQPQSAA